MLLSKYLVRQLIYLVWFAQALQFSNKSCFSGDDLHISVNMRGGPEKWQITGWLQIIGLKKQHEGDYTCIAQNDHGIAQASARVNVVDDKSK